VISAPQVDEAMQAIEDICAERQARLVVVDRDWQWQPGSFDLEGQFFTIGDETYFLPLLGNHQVVNAVTAVAAITGFSAQTGLQVPAEAIKNGLATAYWPGRMEILNRQPYLVVDSAMNGDSAERLVKTLQQYFPEAKITFIFGASSDHPVPDMLKAVLPVAERVFVTASTHPRAAKPETLAAMAADIGYEVIVTAELPVALDQALAGAGPDDLICATGSLFLVAEIRESWLRRNLIPLPPIDPANLFD
jgi:dihydrofolate synthase/folylpolyglutamate synthase